MFAEISALTQSAQTLINLVKSANQLSTDSKIIAAIHDIQAQLLATNNMALEAQEKLTKCHEQIALLKEEKRNLEIWNNEKELVELKEIGKGAFAYVAKDINSNFESTPKLCATCFDNGKKSYLQQSFEQLRRIGLTCQLCSSKAVFNSYLDTARTNI